MVKLAKSLVLFVPLALSAFVSRSQAIIFANDYAAQPIREVHYELDEGSAYLFEGWGDGEAILADKKVYKNLKLRYDQVAEKLIFKYKAEEQPMTFAQQVRGFKVTYTTDEVQYTREYASGFPPVEGTTDQSFFEVLRDGPSSLLKFTSKKILKTKVFNSTTPIAKIQESADYYIFNKSTKAMVKVKLDKKSAIAAIGKDPKKLEAFIKDKNLELKNPYDLAELITYSETL